MTSGASPAAPGRTISTPSSLWSQVPWADRVGMSAAADCLTTADASSARLLAWERVRLCRSSSARARSSVSSAAGEPAARAADGAARARAKSGARFTLRSSEGEPAAGWSPLRGAAAHWSPWLDRPLQTPQQGRCRRPIGPPGRPGTDPARRGGRWLFGEPYGCRLSLRSGGRTAQEFRPSSLDPPSLAIRHATCSTRVRLGSTVSQRTRRSLMRRVIAVLVVLVAVLGGLIAYRLWVQARALSAPLREARARSRARWSSSRPGSAPGSWR